MVTTWGDDTWGVGLWGIDRNPTQQDILDNWPFDEIVPSYDEAVWDFIAAYATQLKSTTVKADKLYEQRFLDSATGRQLELLAAEVGVVRETNESDESLRLRAQLRKALSNSNGTVDDLARLLQIAFGDDTSKISVGMDADEPIVELTIPSALIDDLPITRSRLQAILQDSLPGSDGLTILTDDTFAFGQSGSQGLGKGGLL